MQEIGPNIFKKLENLDNFLMVAKLSGHKIKFTKPKVSTTVEMEFSKKEFFAILEDFLRVSTLNPNAVLTSFWYYNWESGTGCFMAEYEVSAGIGTYRLTFDRDPTKNSNAQLLYQTIAIAIGRKLQCFGVEFSDSDIEIDEFAFCMLLNGFRGASASKTLSLKFRIEVNANAK